MKESRGLYWDGHRAFKPPRELLYQLYITEGMTQPEIAKYFGVSAATIRNLISKNKLQKSGKRS